jgi:hypothetical protein
MSFVSGWLSRQQRMAEIRLGLVSSQVKEHYHWSAIDETRCSIGELWACGLSDWFSDRGLGQNGFLLTIEL